MSEPARASASPQERRGGNREGNPEGNRTETRGETRGEARGRPRGAGGPPQWVGDVLGGPELKRFMKRVEEDYRTGRRRDPPPRIGEGAPCPECGDVGAIERGDGRWERCPHVEREISARRLARAQADAGVSRRHARCSFANFTPAGPREFRAQDAVEEYVEEFAGRLEAGEGLYLFGSSGTGKTHLAYAAINALFDHPRISGGVLAVSALELVDAIKSGFDAPRPTNQGRSRDGADAQARPGERRGERLSAAAREAPLLMFDDLGAPKPSAWLFEQMHLLADHRYRELLPTIVTSNYAPEDLAVRVGSPAASRLLEACPPIEVPGEDHRAKRVTG